MRWCAWLWLRPRASVIPFFVLMVAITSLGIIFQYEHVNEGLEHKVFKGTFLHAFWERMGGYVHLPETANLTVLMHVPRTAGDAMRTHLYGSPRYKVAGLVIDESPIWPKEFRSWPTTFLTPAMIAKSKLPSAKVITGFFSRRDIIRLNVSNKRTIVFLRHPIERILSLLNMVPFRRGETKLSFAEAMHLGDLSQLRKVQQDEDDGKCQAHLSKRNCTGCPSGSEAMWCSGSCAWIHERCVSWGMGVARRRDESFISLFVVGYWRQNLMHAHTFALVSLIGYHCSVHVL